MEEPHFNQQESSSQNFQEKFDAMLSDAEKQIREEPIKAVLIGIGGGFVLSRLPILGLLVLLVRIALWAVKPALLVFGAIKLAGYLKKSQS